VFAVAFELPAASVPWRGGSSVSRHCFCQNGKGKTQMTLPASIKNYKFTAVVSRENISTFLSTSIRIRCSICLKLLTKVFSFSLFLFLKEKLSRDCDIWPEVLKIFARESIADFRGEPKVQCWVEGLVFWLAPTPEGASASLGNPPWGWVPTLSHSPRIYKLLLFKSQSAFSCVVLFWGDLLQGDSQ